MRRLFRKYWMHKDGAIAVETALVTPILIAILLPALDVGYQIYTMQKMNKATDSGIEYVVNGGRDEAIIRQIIQDSFGEPITSSNLEITAYCGCLAPFDDTGDDGTITNPHASVYVKMQTQLADDMCAAVCSDGVDAKELVEVSFDHLVSGTFRDKRVNSRLQTRIK